MNVVFFPRNDYPNNVEVCAHRLGKGMTYTEQTDGVLYDTSYKKFVPMAKARNIKVGCFYNIGTTDPELTDAVKAIIRQDSDNGDVWFDLYSMSSSLQSKIVNKQEISEQEFTAAYNTELLPAFTSVFGKKPVCLSYAFGNTTFADYVPNFFLGARNSDQDRDKTDYGIGYGYPSNIPYTKVGFKSRVSTDRWYDNAKYQQDYQAKLDILSGIIDMTKQTHGWVNNFTHWHEYWKEGKEEWAETYLNMLVGKNANNDIYFAGYGEAVAYLVYRSMISKCVMYSPVGAENEKLVIRLEAKNIFNVDTDLLIVPVSIKFSTANTPLDGQTIRCNYNLINLGSNQYIVEIPYNEYAGVIIEKASK
jgi:hypothetical protein